MPRNMGSLYWQIDDCWPVASWSSIDYTGRWKALQYYARRFYQDVLEFPLTELFENRDYQGSTHFFFDIGNGNLLAFFDFPGLGLGPVVAWRPCPPSR